MQLQEWMIYSSLRGPSWGSYHRFFMQVLQFGIADLRNDTLAQFLLQ